MNRLISPINTHQIVTTVLLIITLGLLQAFKYSNSLFY